MSQRLSHLLGTTTFYNGSCPVARLDGDSATESDEEMVGLPPWGGANRVLADVARSWSSRAPEDRAILFIRVVGARFR
jgi:hypothetical protein